jgi:hypothetical protein
VRETGPCKPTKGGPLRGRKAPRLREPLKGTDGRVKAGLPGSAGGPASGAVLGDPGMAPGCTERCPPGDEEMDRVRDPRETQIPWLAPARGVPVGAGNRLMQTHQGGTLTGTEGAKAPGTVEGHGRKGQGRAPGSARGPASGAVLGDPGMAPGCTERCPPGDEKFVQGLGPLGHADVTLGCR